MRIDSTLLAIDPYSCGCTACLTGVYKPLAIATDDQIQALFLGIVSDHTSAHFDIDQRDDGTFHITVDAYDNYDQQRVTLAYDIAKIAYPVTVEDYNLNIDLDTVVANLVDLRR